MPVGKDVDAYMTGGDVGVDGDDSFVGGSIQRPQFHQGNAVLLGGNRAVVRDARDAAVAVGRINAVACRGGDVAIGGDGHVAGVGAVGHRVYADAGLDVAVGGDCNVAGGVEACANAPAFGDDVAVGGDGDVALGMLLGIHADSFSGGDVTVGNDGGVALVVGMPIVLDMDAVFAGGDVAVGGDGDVAVVVILPVPVDKNAAFAGGDVTVDGECDVAFVAARIFHLGKVDAVFVGGDVGIDGGGDAVFSGAGDGAGVVACGLLGAGAFGGGGAAFVCGGGGGSACEQGRAHRDGGGDAEPRGEGENAAGGFAEASAAEDGAVRARARAVAAPLRRGDLGCYPPPPPREISACGSLGVLLFLVSLRDSESPCSAIVQGESVRSQGEISFFLWGADGWAGGSPPHPPLLHPRLAFGMRSACGGQSPPRPPIILPTHPPFLARTRGNIWSERRIAALVEGG